MSSFPSYSEKTINKTIKRKLKEFADIKPGRHWVVTISIDDKELVQFGFPNPHKKEWNPGKWSDLAKRMNLSKEKFVDFMKCTLSGNDYLKMLKNEASD